MRKAKQVLIRVPVTFAECVGTQPQLESGDTQKIDSPLWRVKPEQAVQHEEVNL
jgi:hypothetical protein